MHDTNLYNVWRSQYYTVSLADLQEIKAQITRFKFKPKVSLLVPIYNTDAKWLKKCVDSVIAQVYTNWELCLCDDGSTVQTTKDFVRSLPLADSRIKHTRLDTNLGISGATNKSYTMATGEIISLLDSDDELSPLALYFTVLEFNERPNLCFVYSDEDLISTDGVLHNPYFKPNWSPDFIRSQDFVCHFTSFRRDLITDGNVVRSEFDGSQDYDLVLRLTDKLPKEQIGHVPWILYHWRTHPESTSTRSQEISLNTSHKAILNHLQRQGLSRCKVTKEWVWWRVHYPLPAYLPLVDFIVPSQNKDGILVKFLHNVIQTTDYPNFRFILSLTKPARVTVESEFNHLVQSEQIIIVDCLDGPFNYSLMVNKTVPKYSTAPLLCFVNDDIEFFTTDWLRVLVSHALRQTIGIVAPKMLFDNGTIQHAGCILGVGGVAGHCFKHWPGDTMGYLGRARLISNFSAVTGACNVMRREVFDRVGLFDEKLSLAYGDIDYCVRVRDAGYDLIMDPNVVVIHRESFTRGLDTTIAQQQLHTREYNYIIHKHGGTLKSDPYYNPNLSLNNQNFELSFPPRLERPWRKGVGG